MHIVFIIKDYVDCDSLWKTNVILFLSLENVLSYSV